MSVSYLFKRGREPTKTSEVITFNPERRLQLDWKAFTKNHYAPYADRRKVTYFFPRDSFPKDNFTNVIVVPEDYPEGVIPRKIDRINHYNLMVQFYEKTGRNPEVLAAINKWKRYLFGGPIPKPRTPIPKLRKYNAVISYMIKLQKKQSNSKFQQLIIYGNGPSYSGLPQVTYPSQFRP